MTTNTIKNKKTTQSGRFLGLTADIATFLLVLVVGQIGAVAGYAILSGFELEGDIVTLLAFLIGGSVMLVLLMALMKIGSIPFASTVGLRRPIPKDAIYVVLGYGMYYAAVFTGFILVSLFLPTVNLQEHQELGLSRNMQGWTLLLAFLVLTVLPSFSEELLFRGFLYNRLRHWRISAVWSAIVTSLLFGLVHRQLNVFIDTFVLSMIIIYVYEFRGRNIWIPIGIHWLKNTIVFLGLFVFRLPMG